MSDNFLEPMGQSKSHYEGWRKRANKDSRIGAKPRLVRRRRVQETLLAARDIKQQFEL